MTDSPCITTAVITGAGRGIGRALAQRLSRAGVRVVVNDIDPISAEAVAAEVGGVVALGDASTEVGVGALHATAVEHLGTIDAWFANAGVDLGRGMGTTVADWSIS